MSKSLKVAVLSISVVVVLVAVVGGLGVKASSDDGAYRQLGVYSEVLSRIRTEYVEDPNIPKVTDGALHGLLESLDANSSYLNPAQYKQYKEHKSDGKGTIGAAVSKRYGYAAVISTLPGGPADKAGVDTGDIIEAIEGRSTREMSLAEVNTLLSGQPGSNVSISIVRTRKVEPQKLTITRTIVSVPPATDKLLEDGIGYIRVDALTKGKAQEIAAKIKDLQKQGAKKLVLDLRNVAIGEEEEGIAAANLFLNHGVITYIQGQKYGRKTFDADPSKAITNLPPMPLAVLVNRGTAGAAEIVAAAVLDNARGDVLGDKTFGVGSVQNLINMPDGSALILSVAKYYTPNGKAIQDSAVTPNILVADQDDEAVLPDENETESVPPEERKTNKNDEQLKRAIDVLKAKPLKA
ncbi:MAG TPA: S41 family peptidase [Terriglobales bacterium]|nr:S41 family peptidase [Terriglobales bacterium]